ncbi:MAG TPA: M17 family peptidase N-terminal domain-containing protein, partial [Candidatus Polarisedimenticolia bacterium]|nr:M17 family peptidase N-terminal domain-containing protein [Candidatus Polarisedimenticolia bacterium]
MADRSGAAGRTGSIPAGTPVPAVASSTGSFTSARSDLAVCFAWEGGRLSVPGTPAASALLKALVRAAREDGFKGKRRESFFWPSGGRFPSARYLMVGLGKREGADLDRVRDGCGLAARKGSALKSVRRMTIALPEVPGEASAAAIAAAATEGVILGSYRMLKYMTGDEARPTSLRAVDLLVAKGTLADARPGVSRGACRGAAVTLARDLVNEPAGSLTPSLMAQAARDVAKRAGLEIRIHGEKDLEKLGMGALLGVSAGSAQPPCLIHLIYRPRRARGPLASIALVGKGLTFDSG